MFIGRLKRQCPYCKSFLLERKHRKTWMRLIPKTRYYLCNNCLRNFIVICKIYSVYIPLYKGVKFTDR